MTRLFNDPSSFVEEAVVNPMRNHFPGRPPGPTGV